MAGCRSHSGMTSDFVSVFFDLEATGGSDWDQIIQIGAVTKRNNGYFCRYILPSISIPSQITDLTGFSKYNNKLYQNGKQVPTTPLSKVLEDFLAYLEHFDKPVILIAHNAFRLDCQFLIKVYKQYGLLGELSNVVQGFCDSLPLLQHYMPDMKAYSLKSLVRELIDPSFTGHDAVDDSRGLASIFLAQKFTKDEILEFSASFDEIVRKEENRLAVQENLETLQPLQSNVAKKILEKMAKAGMNLDNLQDRWYSQGQGGLKQYLSEFLPDGKPRITSDWRLIRHICDAVEQTL